MKKKTIIRKKFKKTGLWEIFLSVYNTEYKDLYPIQG